MSKSYSGTYSGGGRKKSVRLRQLLLVLAVVPLLALGLMLWRVGGEVGLLLETDRPGIGPSTRVTGVAEAGGRGLGTTRLLLRQGDLEVVLDEATATPRAWWAFWGPRETRLELTSEVVGTKVEGLAEGEAELVLVSERPRSPLRRPDPIQEISSVPVRLVPPSLSVLSDLIYVAQGGSEAVVYRVGETSVRDGVRAGDSWFPGYPLPGGGADERLALFAVPYDLSDSDQIRLVAEDELGNRAESAFLDRFFAKPLKTSQIRLDDRFLQKVVPEIAGRTPQITAGDDLLATYLEINGDLRRINAEELQQLAARSEPRFLWRDVFLQQPNTQVMDQFAARRTYTYDGKTVDTQDHLGFDLASVRRAPVLASNDGKVVMARYFGIYGNTVVLDHGFGLMTLYAHLSSIDVDEGQSVERGATVGRSGETGLAGGDHLHFSVLLQGLPVNPIEWLDRKWITDRLALKLGDAMPF